MGRLGAKKGFSIFGYTLKLDPAWGTFILF